MSRLAIMVINWNNSDDSEECIESLLVQDTDLTILSIDNDSSQEDQQKLQNYIEEKKLSGASIEFVETGYNGGTAGGFNAGVRWAQENNYDYIGTLNADAIADKSWVKSLLEQLENHPEAGIATGILARRDGKTIDTTGDFYSTWGIPSPRLRDQSIDKAPQEAGEVFGSSGGGFLARTSMFEHIGLFDEKFFMYFEDVDLCFRAQLAGFKVHYTPKAIAYHKLGASSSTVPGLAVFHTFKNLPLLFIKNVPRSILLTIWPRFTLSYFLILGNAIKNGRGKYALKGWLTKFTLIPHALRERNRIQHSKTASDEYIGSIILHDIPPEQTGLRKFRKIFTGKS